MQKTKLPENFWIIFISCLFSAMFVFTNIFDWDFFLTTLEVDVRSFVLDQSFPSWSYQFCAGSTRAGDPQSYGLSPLMIIPIFLGSFWGSKALLLLATFIGAAYLKKIIHLVGDGLSNLQVNLLIFAFIFNNFFLFHFSNGHLSFSSVFYALPLFYLLLKVIKRVPLTTSELIANAIYLYLLLSGPFYQASIYFILPLVLACLLYLITDFKLILTKDFLKLTGSGVVALILSFYRLLPVMEYQKAFPRTLNTIEWNHLGHIFLYFFAPLKGRNFLWDLPHNAMFGVSENNFFGAIPLVLLVVLLVKPKQSWQWLKTCDPLIKLSFCLILVGVSLSLGNLYSFMPFTLINSLFSKSIRVVGRFNLVTYLGLFLILVLLLKNIVLSRLTRIMIHLMLACFSLFCVFQHYSIDDSKLSLFNTSLFLKVEAQYPVQMQTIHVGKARDMKMSYMYMPTLLGMSVPSCYQPMSRRAFLMSERFMEAGDQFDFHFMVGKDQTPECLEKSYFTQADIYIDSSCQKGSRVHLNFIEDKLLKKFNIEPRATGYFLE